MLHYQPLIDLLTGEMTRRGGLIRWPDPNGGLVPPGDFIPLAEEMGLIEAIGAWVIDEVRRQERDWREQGSTRRSSSTCRRGSSGSRRLVDRIARPILGSGHGSEPVTVEITESTAMTNPDRTLGDPPRAARPRAPARDRRLRDRLFLARAAPVHAGRHPQDRSVVRPRARPRRAEREHGLGDGRAGLQPRDDPPRRRHRDRGGVARADGTGMRTRAGLLLLPAGPGGGDPRDPSARRLRSSTAARAG